MAREPAGVRPAARYIGLEFRVYAVLGRLKAELGSQTRCIALGDPLRTAFDRWWDTWIEPELQEAEKGSATGRAQEQSGPHHASGRASTEPRSCWGSGCTVTGSTMALMVNDSERLSDRALVEMIQEYGIDQSRLQGYSGVDGPHGGGRAAYAGRRIIG